MGLEPSTGLSYRIVYRSGHNGIEIDHEDCEQLLSRSRMYGGIMLKNGANNSGCCCSGFGSKEMRVPESLLPHARSSYVLLLPR